MDVRVCPWALRLHAVSIRYEILYYFRAILFSRTYSPKVHRLRQHPGAVHRYRVQCHQTRVFDSDRVLTRFQVSLTTGIAQSSGIPQAAACSALTCLRPALTNRPLATVLWQQPEMPLLRS